MSRTEKISGKYLMALLLAVMVAISLHSGAKAQGYDNETVRGALERTEAIIAEARPIIEESRSNIARLALERAISLQNKASSFFTAERAQFAYKYTMEAREEARHAIALARQEARIEDKLVNVSENTREGLIRLRERVVESGIRDERLGRLMLESREQLEKAHTNAQQLRNQLAINFAENARKLFRQAEKRFRQLLSDRELIQRRLALMENLARRARERQMDGGSESDSAMLEKAEGQLTRAREMIGESNFKGARMMLERCERTLRAIARDAAGNGQPDGHSFMAETERLMERAREMISGDEEGTGQAVALYEEAEALMQRARERVSEGKTDEALRMMRQVRNLLRRAVDPAGTGQGAGAAEEEIDQVIRLRDSIEETVNGCSAAGARKLFARAENRLGSAMDHFEAGRIDRAYAEARIARNLFQRIREICSE